MGRNTSVQPKARKSVAEEKPPTTAIRIWTMTNWRTTARVTYRDIQEPMPIAKR
jgi:hypothetical protein